MERPRWQPLSLFVWELATLSEESGTPTQPDESASADRLRSLLANAAAVAVTAEHALNDRGPA